MSSPEDQFNFPAYNGRYFSGIPLSNLKELEGLIGKSWLDSAGKLQYSGSLAQVMAVGGFRFKALNSSHMKDPEARKHLGQVLGHDWCPDEDTLSFKFILKAKMNTTRKEEVITKDNVEDIKGIKRNEIFLSGRQKMQYRYRT